MIGRVRPQVLRRLVAAAVTAVIALSSSADTALAYPSADAEYLDYAEMVAEIHDIAASDPAITQLFSIGRSHEGRELWAAKISDSVSRDEDEPEVLFDGGMHGREHLSTEMAVALFRKLVDGYGSTSRVTNMVNRNEITIIFNLNPDGSEYDHASGTYRMWRKNREPTPGSTQIGTDINRNFGYRWGTNPLNASPGAETYRGPSAWSTPEAAAFRRYVDGRVVSGEQQVRVHVTFHQHGRVVLYPYGYTTAALPSDMHPEDHDVLVAMAAEMGRRSGYASAQSSSGNVNVGNQMDWLYATYRIMTFTFEMGDAFYMGNEAIASETARNMEAAYYAIERAACPYVEAGRRSGLCFANPFWDINASPFQGDIMWIFAHEITAGCSATRYCPDARVTRAQMASFLTRALDLRPAPRDYFGDDEQSIHEADINAMAHAGITAGCDDDRFCPGASVTRDQMASFLARAFSLPLTSRDYFSDDNSNMHEGNINALADSDITGGCGPSTYCPNAAVTRGQMAAFLYRALTR